MFNDTTIGQDTAPALSTEILAQREKRFAKEDKLKLRLNQIRLAKSCLYTFTEKALDMDLDANFAWAFPHAK